MPGSNGNSTAWDAGTPGTTSTSGVNSSGSSSSGGFNISGGSGILSGILSFITSLISMSMQNKANREASQQQRWYYEDEKQYNSPQNQMMMRRAAGLNPYSQFINGSVSAPQTPVNLNEGIPEIMNSMSNGFQKNVENMFNRETIELAKKQFQLQSKKTDAELLLTEQEIDSLKKRNVSQDLDNYKKLLESPFWYNNAYIDSEDKYYTAGTKMAEWMWAPKYFENRANDVMNSAYLKKQQYLFNESTEQDRKDMISFQREVMEQKSFIIRKIDEIDNPTIRTLAKMSLFGLTDIHLPF